MVARITHATRYVRDEEEALAFYRDVLGFEINSNMPMGENLRWITISTPEQKDFELVLFDPTKWMTGEEQKAMLEQIGKQSQLIFSTHDIEALYKQLIEKGVHLDTPAIRDLPWGRDLVFSDLYGNSINVVEALKA
jgi:uncharacterized glyoxalase superfamily protein PhnB